jgi:hypothetical protein
VEREEQRKDSPCHSIIEVVHHAGLRSTKPGCERKATNPVSPSDQHLKELIQVLMQFLEKRNSHPILFSSADDYDRFLKCKEIDTSSLICLDQHLRQRASPRS